METELEKQKPGVKAWIVNPTHLNTTIPLTAYQGLKRIEATLKANGDKKASMAKVITMLVERYEGEINAK